jgi:hypothetical protein
MTKRSRNHHETITKPSRSQHTIKTSSRNDHETITKPSKHHQNIITNISIRASREAMASKHHQEFGAQRGSDHKPTPFGSRHVHIPPIQLRDAAVPFLLEGRPRLT